MLKNIDNIKNSLENINSKDNKNNSDYKSKIELMLENENEELSIPEQNKRDVNIFIFGFVPIIILSVISFSTMRDNQEISNSSYKTVMEMKKMGGAKLSKLIAEAKLSDGMITGKEFSNLIGKSKKLQIEQIKSDLENPSIDIN